MPLGMSRGGDVCVPAVLQMGVGLSIAEELGKRQAAKEEESKEAAAPDQPEQPESTKNSEG